MKIDFTRILSEQYSNPQWIAKLESEICKKHSLDSLSSVTQVIRNAQGWRDNEKKIDYIWIANIGYFSFGFAGLITIKFGEHKFRGINNKAELVQDIFTFDSDANIIDFYSEVNTNEFQDPIRDMSPYDLFENDKSITLDGKVVKFDIRLQNMRSVITLYNQSSPYWNKWDRELHKLGKRLAINSGNQEFIKYFE
jgi:hypothetical protein